MPLNSQAVAVFAGSESTYGTAVALTGANYIQTSKSKWTPKSTTVSREIDRPSFGGDIKLHVGVHCELEFRVELAGSGSLGVAPKFGRLLKACKMAEAIIVATSVGYKFATGGTDSLTMYFQMDGQRHAMVGCRGSFKIDINSQQIPYIDFMFKGLWVAPSSVADLVPVTTGWVQPRIITNANTQPISYSGHSAVFMKYLFDAGNQVEHFDNPGEESVQIVDRECVGDFKMLAPAISVKDFFTESLFTNATAPLDVVHGSTAGNIISLLSPAAQLLEPVYGEDRKRATLEGKLSFPYTGTNDEELEILCA